jgi:DNA-binding CsgD family transcriptional regulator
MDTAKQRAECWKLRQQGVTIARICRRLALSRKQVKRHISEYEDLVRRREWAKLLLGQDAIERLGLTNGVYNALKRAGVQTISEVEHRLDHRPYLSDIRRIGQGAVGEIRRAVETYRAMEKPDETL